MSSVVRTSVMGKDGRDVRMDYTMGRSGEPEEVVAGLGFVTRTKIQEWRWPRSDYLGN